MDVSINKLDAMHIIEIDNTIIRNVVDYQVITSMHGESELMLKIKVPIKAGLIELTTNS